MGWWHYNILGGDPPLDTLGELADAIGVKTLYPLKFNARQTANIRAKLEAMSDDDLTRGGLGSDEALPVVAAVFLTVGAAMTPFFKTQALRATRDDVFGGPDWNDGGVGRDAVMDNHYKLIEAHEPGKCVDIEQKGLFEVFNEKNKPKPRWRHDCERCTFLGRFNQFDLYHCGQSNFPTVIARFSDEGPDYLSGMVFANVSVPLREAKRLAEERGLLCTEEK